MEMTVPVAIIVQAARRTWERLRYVLAQTRNNAAGSQPAGSSTRSSQLRKLPISQVTTMPRTTSSATASDQGSTVPKANRSEEHTSELQSQFHLVCRLLLEKK